MSIADLRRAPTLAAVAEDVLSVDDDTPFLSAETAAGLETVSRPQLLRRSRQTAYRLISAGLERGEPIVVSVPNGIELAQLFIAAWRLGVVLVPTDPQMTAETVARITQRAGARWFIGDDPPADVVALGLAGITDPSTADLPTGWEARVADWPQPDRSDLAAVMYTSGTTDQPRGVMISHATTLDPLAQYLGTPLMRLFFKLRYRGKRPQVGFLPMSHASGLGQLTSALIFGMPLVYVASHTPRALLRAFRTYQPATFMAPPRLLELLWRQLVREIEATGVAGFERRRQSAQRLPYRLRRRMFRRELALIGGKVGQIYTGMAYLPPDVQLLWESIGIPVLQAYGATESGAVSMSTNSRHVPGAVGAPSRLARLEFADDGEMLVSGPSVAKGYWRDEEATATAWDEQGRYHTGDIGQIDAKGNLRLVGRKRNVIVLANGLNVFPEDIESVVRAVGLGDSVVVETRPGRIEAVIPSGSAPTEQVEAAIRLANARLPAHSRIDGWRFWPDPDFPRTHTEKIRRGPVREWAVGEGAIPLPIQEA